MLTRMIRIADSDAVATLLAVAAVFVSASIAVGYSLVVSQHALEGEDLQTLIQQELRHLGDGADAAAP